MTQDESLKPRRLRLFSSGRTDLAQLASEGLQGMVLAALEDNSDLIDAARALLEQPDDLMARLRALAEEQDVPLTDIVREALERYLRAVRPRPKGIGMFESEEEIDLGRQAGEMRLEPPEFRQPSE